MRTVLSSSGPACLSILLLFYLANDGLAQQRAPMSLSGVVMNEAKIPLPFVAIILKAKADSAIIKTTVSELDGTFKLVGVSAGTFILETSMLGYESIRKEIDVGQAGGNLPVGTLQLTPLAQMLSAVTVSGQKPFIERRADKLVINLTDQLTGGSSLMDVMDRLPGVQLNLDNQISLNGRNVQIYIDGKATPLSADALAGLLRGMSSTSIEKIELIARPSSKYDASANGGVINVVRKRGAREGLKGNLYGGGGIGRYPKVNGGFNLNFKTGKYNLLINTDYNGNKYYVDNSIKSIPVKSLISSAGATQSAIRSIRQTNNITPNLGLDYYLTKKTTLSLAVTNALQLFRKTAYSQIRGIEEPQARENSDNQVKTTTNTFSSGFHLLHQLDTLGKELTVDVDYYRNTSNSNQYTTERFFDQPFDAARHTFLDQRNAFNIYSAKADLSAPFNNKAQLETGFKSSYVETNNRNVLYDRKGVDLVRNDSQEDTYQYSETIHALYTTFRQERKKLSYQLGLRAEMTYNRGRQLQANQSFGQQYVQLFPSAFFDYKINNKHGFIVGVDKKINRPTYENMNPLLRIVNANNFVQGNPALRPVSSYTGSATYAFRNALFITASYSIDVGDFTYVAFQNPAGDSITIRPLNNRYTQTYSLLTAYNSLVKSWWYTSTSINLRKSAYQLVGDEPKIVGIGTVNVDTYNSFSITKQLSWLVLFRYRGKAQERNVTTDAYFTLTTGLRQSLLGKRATVSLNVTDVFHTYKSQYSQESILLRQRWNNQYETTTVRLNGIYNFGGQVAKIKTSSAANDEKRRSDTKEN
ncbi:TonB-dependent receptor family protein [Spirosoma sp. RP8]|uniref:TonB-dependent receptor family protein n=1 Tax=Spirosoma liriopis TaxID=2937440 RepID=A0ABT0HSV5_9BACT|nr:outer membrane beta-barrel family protein [Spirosoma liriopis]MCK8495253.1 TonB-dependent receptor family protein [Spirosoma liriopis]